VLTSDPIELEVVEDYRRQRQDATARRSGFDAMEKPEFYQWLDKNRERLIEITLANGTPPELADELVSKYESAVREIQVAGKFDDVNAQLILKGIIKKIEEACRSAGVPIGGVVSFGTSPEFGLGASQLAVMQSEASILQITFPLVSFFSQISKLLALSMPYSVENGIIATTCDPNKVITRIRDDRKLLAGWVRTIAAYALHGWPPRGPIITTGDMIVTATRASLLEAMELFVVGHEYGHHVLKHGRIHSSNDDAQRSNFENEADLFARSISMAIGSNSSPPNFVAMSGAGAVIALSSIDLVHRSRRMIDSGADKPVTVDDSHPALTDRIKHISVLDKTAPDDYASAFEDIRSCYTEIFNQVWSELLPLMGSLHSKGIRPTVT
jgi:hypothetical protein